MSISWPRGVQITTRLAPHLIALVGVVSVSRPNQVAAAQPLPRGWLARPLRETALSNEPHSSPSVRQRLEESEIEACVTRHSSLRAAPSPRPLCGREPRGLFSGAGRENCPRSSLS